MSARGSKGPGGFPVRTSWDPIQDLMTLKERMNRLLESVLRKGDFEKEVAGWSPSVDLREDREGFHLTAELPGVRREDLRIRLEGSVLTLEGERPMDDDTREADHLRVERSYGPFTRTFHLPSAVDEGKITARFSLGVLEVFLPRSADSRTRSIKVRVV